MKYILLNYQFLFLLCELFLKFCENKPLFLTSKQTAIRQSFDIACLGAIEIGRQFDRKFRRAQGFRRLGG